MPPRAAPERTRDRDRTRAEILAVATEEFSEHGYSGARVDEIAERTRTTKRMLYYYFESKEGLYAEVLKDAYAAIRRKEQSIDVDHLDPVAAIRRIAELTFDHHESHPDFIRLVAIENIHRAEHLAGSRALAEMRTPALEILGRILARGRAEGVFARDVDAVDVHMMISAYACFHVANRHTFSTIFKVDMTGAAATAARRESVTEMILRFVAP